MSTSCVEHKLPDQYLDTSYYDDLYDDLEKKNTRIICLKGTSGELAEKAAILQALLDKWDAIMNNPDIPDSDKALFKAAFLGKMEAIEDGPDGSSMGEGFDDILKALETGNMGALNKVLLDIEDMDELFNAFNEAFTTARNFSGITEPTESNVLARMFFTGDTSGYERYKLEQSEKERSEEK